MATIAEMIGKGAQSARPAYGVEGRLYYNEDTSQWERDSGSAWEVAVSAGQTYTKTITLGYSGTLAVGSLAARVHVPVAGTITNVTAAVGTAPTDASLIVDVNKNGTTIFTTQGNRPTITTGNTEDLSSTPDVTSLALNDVITVDVDQIGSTVAGADLVVQVRYTAVTA